MTQTTLPNGKELIIRDGFCYIIDEDITLSLGDVYEFKHEFTEAFEEFALDEMDKQESDDDRKYNELEERGNEKRKYGDM